jgi:O-antigen/teichoic acid export membrane protein
MSKAAEMGKVSAKGSFHLLWGLVASTLISAIGTIFIGRLLGSDNYGLYGIVLTVPNLFIILRDWGMNTAMTRCAAQYRAENRYDELRSIFVSGLIFEIASGLILTIIAVTISGFLATTVFHRPIIAPLIQIASISIFVGALTNATTALFTGLERMELNSIVQVAQATIKTAVIIGLVLIGFGTTGAVIGYTTGTIVAATVGLLFMGLLYKKLPKPVTLKLEIKAYIGTMLSYGLPISFATIISGLLIQFYMILLPIHYVTDNVMIGNYTIAQNFVVLIGFFSTPITTILFPAFSKLNPQKDRQALKNVFQYSVKYAALLVVPVTALVMCLSVPAVSTLFGNTYESAPLFLSLLAVSYLYTAFGNLSASNLLMGQGKTSLYLRLTLLTASIGFPLSYVLIMNFGVLGLIATSLVAGIPSLIINLWCLHRDFDVSIDWVSSAKILFSSTITAVLTYFIVQQIPFADWIKLVLGALVFLIILIPAMLLTRTVTHGDISNLQGMISGLGTLGGILNKLLNIIEKAMTFLKL